MPTFHITCAQTQLFLQDVVVEADDLAAAIGPALEQADNNKGDWDVCDEAGPIFINCINTEESRGDETGDIPVPFEFGEASIALTEDQACWMQGRERLITACRDLLEMSPALEEVLSRDASWQAADVFGDLRAALEAAVTVAPPSPSATGGS